ncbi:NADH dehydrogenase [ubiquinone] 1 alpha subcomplex assembly factor 2 [Entomortierella parvispora]|uniref:NADH dehydrogenase [ubiquinone] 1 alpha subcomplex assembly factor 2 n=1 Tax=Entomortierella parvispora TaxID=205924 RepID=A0A9P3HKL1_9FUNG|nr:NADH dehydrogenase [ubiquinone] 1 alpha subcomplex assembly factor 2 [Entomortierella parvispora]
MANNSIPLMRRLALSLKAIAPGGGRRLAGKDLDGNLYFEKPDPNGGRYPRRTVELANPELNEANYDDANITVQWQSWLRNTRQNPPTLAEIQRDEARKQLTITRAKALDQAWQDRKAELAMEQAQDRKAILGLAQASSSAATTAASATKESAEHKDSAEDDTTKSAARKQIEEREASRKAGFKPQVQQGDTFEPQAWSPVASRRR